MSSSTADSRRSQEIRTVIQRCVARLSAGEDVRDAEVLAAHPQLLPELADALANMRRVAAAYRQAAAASRAPHIDQAAERISDPSRAASSGGTLCVRCPHCHTPTNVISDSPLINILCSSCGNRFGLLSDTEAVAGADVAKRIARFELIERLGAGGFGTVWKARDTELDRLVAVKIPRRGQLSTTETEQFLREARAAAQLRHPAIVSVHEVGRDDNTVYIVSDLVEGISLAELMAEQRLTARESARLCARVAEALQHAHERGIIHRDLKPANILLGSAAKARAATATGPAAPAAAHPRTGLHRPYLTDFGLARRETGEATLTIDGQLVGTPAYMSPEQARGESHHVDRRSDIYSLGVILFELLTGELPFRGTVRMLLRQVLEDDPPSPRRLNASVPRDLETIMLKCLEKDPASRYASAQVVADELNRFLRGEPIQARPLGRTARACRWCRRRPALAALTGTVATLIFLIGVGGTIAAFQFRSQTREAEENLYFSRIADAHHELALDNLRRVQELLERCPRRLRGWEWGYLQRRSRFEPTVLRGPEQGITSVAFSGNGTKLACAGKDGTLQVFDVWTGDVVQTITAHAKSVYSVAFHPTENLLASAGTDEKVKLWDLTTGNKILETSGHAGEFTGVAYALAFSHDGKRLAYGSDAQTMRVCAVPSGEQVFELPGHERLASAVAFNPDDTIIVTGSFGGELNIWDAMTGTNRKRLAQAHGLPITAITFSPDGRFLATGSFDRLIKIWDTTTWHVVQTLRGHSGLVVGLAYSPDGQRLASSGELKTVRLWEPLTGREILTIRDYTNLCSCVAFSRNGLLASSSLDGTARVYDPTTPEENERLWSWTGEHEGEVWGLAFHPNGHQLASVAWDRTMRFWDPVDGRPQQVLSQPGDVMSLTYFHDGKYVAVNGGSNGSTSLGIMTWDYATGQQSGPPLKGVGRKHVVIVSPDNRYVLAEDTSGRIGIWNLRTRQHERSFGGPKQQLWCLQFSPDGQRLISAGNTYPVQLWPWHPDRLEEMTTPLLELPEVRVVGSTNRATFSYDGKRLIEGGREHTVKIWDATSGELLHTLSGHTGDVFAVAVSPDGRWLASGGEDTTIRLWDAETGEARYKLRGHMGVINCLAFGPDSRRLVSGSRDNSVKVWELDRLSPKGQ